MKVKVRTIIDFKTLKHYNWYRLKYRVRFQLIYWFLAAVSLGLAGWMLYKTIVAAQAGESYTTNAIFTGLLVLFGAYLVYKSFTLEKMLDSQLIAHFTTNRKGKLDLVITEEEITAVNDQDEPVANHAWALATEIIELPDYYFVLFGKMPVIISRDANNILEGNPEDLVALVAKAAATVKKHRVITKEICKRPITFVHPEDQIAASEAVAVEAEVVQTEAAAPEAEVVEAEVEEAELADDEPKAKSKS